MTCVAFDRSEAKEKALTCLLSWLEVAVRADVKSAKKISVSMRVSMKASSRERNDWVLTIIT